ncbi:hypothetical protein LJC49_00225 [Ruminococcaceae bacterium OttesenSCG-928-I18]|nr:hypothetical protein [Ruminococcaceae bacterium OttesenSCG-928-I18]
MATENTPKKKNETIDKEEARRNREEQSRRSRRRTRQLVGLALTVLIVVGAVSIIRGGMNLARDMMDDTNEMEVYAQRITPLVWFDVLPFESLEEADTNVLRQAVIWGVLNEMGNDVEYNELGQPQVPAVEVDRYAAELFGPDFKFEHVSFEDPVQDLSYEYDPVTNMYTTTATGLTPQYMSTVVNIERVSSGVKRVTAGYVGTMNSNEELIATPDLDHPTKYMDYYFRRDGNAYYLYALRANTSYVPESTAETQSGVESASLPPSSSALSESESGVSTAAQTTSQSASGSGSLAESEEDTTVVPDTGQEQDA